VVDDAIVKLMKSGEINDIYAKWFTKPVPPNNVNLNYPMPSAVKEVFKNPNNKGI
jgi:glutamate/aspartate transport system substrate-binding protein